MDACCRVPSAVSSMCTPYQLVVDVPVLDRTMGSYAVPTASIVPAISSSMRFASALARMLSVVSAVMATPGSMVSVSPSGRVMSPISV